MTPIIICVVISGIITLLITTQIMHKQPYTCYFLMVIIPLSTLLITLFFSPIQSQGQQQNATERAETHIKNGDFINAIKIIEQLIEKKGKNRDIATQLGRAYFAKGLLHAEHNEKEQALYNLIKAQTIFPKDSPYTTDLQEFIDKVGLMSMEK